MGAGVFDRGAGGLWGSERDLAGEQYVYAAGWRFEFLVYAGDAGGGVPGVYEAALSGGVDAAGDTDALGEFGWVLTEKVNF